MYQKYFSLTIATLKLEVTGFCFLLDGFTGGFTDSYLYIESIFLAHHCYTYEGARN
jgi:hypothetical protein